MTNSELIRKLAEKNNRIAELEALIGISQAGEGRALEKSPPSEKHNQQLITICSYCRKLLDERGNWLRVEAYLLRTFKLRCTHGICPECSKRIARDL